MGVMLRVTSRFGRTHPAMNSSREDSRTGRVTDDYGSDTDTRANSMRSAAASGYERPCRRNELLVC
jgi:hypothetical protein